MYNVHDIAKYIIWRETRKGRPVSNLRLQKLLYFVYTYFLSNCFEPCFSEPIEAWTFGPVVPIVYGEYKIFGSSSISSPKNFFADFLLPSHRNVIDKMLDACAKYTTGDLVEVSHQQSPWQDAYANPFSHRITKDAVLKYLKESNNVC